jgi:molecular chaperone HscB
MPMAFLMQQMEWREELGDARAAKDMEALEGLDQQLRRERKTQLAAIEQQIGSNDYVQAAQGVRALMFIEKLKQEIDSALSLLEDA